MSFQLKTTFDATISVELHSGNQTPSMPDKQGNSIFLLLKSYFNNQGTQPAVVF